MKGETSLPLVTPEFREEICSRATIENGAAAKLRQIKPKIKLDPRAKPIMAEELEQQINAALAQYEDRKLWKEWGLDNLRKQGNAILMYGPPGTGKTTIFEYMAKRLGKGMLRLNMKDVGGKAPGHTERMVAGIFTEGRQNGDRPIFIDECEAILWDRGRAGSDSMWMVGVIDELLMQIATYKGLIGLCTNRVDIIDPALKDRCFAVLEVGMPEHKERVLIWKQKIPVRFPLKLTTVQFQELANANLSGRAIETAIVREASLAITQKRLPTFDGLLQACK